VSTTGVGDTRREGLGFGIRNIVPNPAVGRASVSFATSREGHAQVDVFDVAGQRVRTLANGLFEPGLHTVTWDGLDSQGGHARPGAYFVRVPSGAQSSTHMIILRP